MAAKSRIVKWQKVREVRTKGTNGEQSAYWKWAFQHNRMNEDGEVAESRLSNPDSIAVEEDGDTVNQNRLVMQEVLKRAKLSKMERAVVYLFSEADQTEENVAKVLRISRRSVRTYLKRAQQKCEKLYVAKIRNQDDIDEQEAVK